MTDAPAGFDPLFRRTPFTDLIGPLFSMQRGNRLTIGLRVEPRHCNGRGTVHGGVLATLADITLGYSVAFSQDPPLGLTTASLTLDFLGSAVSGDWIEAYADFQKAGSRLAFANAYVVVGEKPILRASGVFSRSGDLGAPVASKG